MASCPKCGRAVKPDAVVCAACDFVLDASFLGDDILDESKVDEDVFGGSQGEIDASFGEDAVILGDAGGEFESFEAEDTGFVQRELTNARIYVGGATQSLLRADAIPALKKGVDTAQLKLNPYELHILQFVNGRRPVGRIRRKSGMEDPDVKLALAMLSDKGVIELAGHVSDDRKQDAKAKRRARLRAERDAARGRSKGERPRGDDKHTKERRAPDDDARRPEAKRDDQRDDKRDEKRAAKKRKRSSASSAPKHEATRVEALPASLRDELARSAAAPSPSPEEETRRKRRRPASGATRIVREESKVEAAPSVPSAPPHMRSLEVNFEGGEDGEFTGDTEVLAEGAAPPKRDDVHREVTFIKKRPTAGGDDEAGVSPVVAGGPLDLHDAPTGPVKTLAPPVEGADALDELPTGPVAPLASAAVRSDQHGHGFDDSMLPTGEVPALVSLSGFDGSTGSIKPGRDDPNSMVLLSKWPGEPVVNESPILDDVAPLPPPPLAAPPLPGSTPPPLPVSARTTSAPPPLPGAAVLPPLPGTASATPGADADADLAIVDDEPPAVAIPRAIPALPQTPVPPPPLPTRAPPVDDEEDDERAAVENAIAEDSDEAAPVAPAAVAPPAGSSSVSFENRRKAEKIFEQAERDFGEGKISSARMNAKLAMIYDPVNPRYRDCYESWGVMQAAAPATTRRDVFLFQQAKEREAKGDFKGAASLLEEALTVNPSAAPVLNLLGVIHATRFRDYKRASTLLLKACELQPSNLSFKNNLGKVLGMAEDARDKGVDDGADEGEPIKVKKMRPKMF